MLKIKKPELLAPAGDLEKLKIAVTYGADAVYIGGEKYGLRSNAKNFGADEMAEGILFAHKNNVKVYVAINIFAKNEDLNGLEDYLRHIKDLNADALIISDPGIFMTAAETVPEMNIHISTQANNTNYKSVSFWKKHGAKRVVLARELSFDEISEIKNKNDDIEVETFVHGAMCVSYSGRCLISNWLTSRDANRGDCSQPCRWEYYLSERKRPGEYMPVAEDDRGTYLYNSKDLCLIKHIPELINAGVDSLKIEGRMKSVYYVASAVKAYRRAINDYFKDPGIYEKNIDGYMDELNKSSHRDFTTGFYTGGMKNGTGMQAYESAAYIRTYDFVGMVLVYDASSQIAVVEQRNKFAKGDSVEILTPCGDGFTQRIDEMYDENGEMITEAPHAQQIVKIKMSKPVKKFDLIRMKIKK